MGQTRQGNPAGPPPNRDKVILEVPTHCLFDCFNFGCIRPKINVRPQPAETMA
jgi:hypothetical protein